MKEKKKPGYKREREREIVILISGIIQYIAHTKILQNDIT